MGFLDRPRRLASRSERGQVSKLASKRSKRLSAAGVEVPAKPDCEPKRFVREFRGSADGLEVGQEVKADVLEGVAAVDVVVVTFSRSVHVIMVIGCRRRLFV